MVLAVLTLRLVQLTPRVAPAPSDELAQDSQTVAPLEGMEKERFLAAFIRWQYQKAVLCRGDASRAAAENDSISKEPPVHITLSGQLFRSSSSTQLHGLLKSLQHLVQMQQHTLRPAAPFLVFLFATILQQLVPTKLGECLTSEELHEVAGQDAADSGTDEEQDTEILSKAIRQKTEKVVQNVASDSEDDQEDLTAAVNVRHRKHCIRIAIDSLHWLISSFSDFIDSWKVLLAPAAPSLQLLLSTAVETGAAGHLGEPKRSGSCPAIVRFVASWATNAVSHQIYFR